MIELSDVTKRYGDGPTALEVLRAVTLTIEAGQAVGVVGPSGCGKSTLLNLIGLLDRPTVGRIRLAGRDVVGLSDAEASRIRREQIGYIFQRHFLLPQCTVLENVLVPTLAESRSSRADEQRARSLLERVGLGDRLNALPGQLSGGQRQRVAVARALINEPAVVLADEPTGSLDPKTAAGVYELLWQLQRDRQVTWVMVTHDESLAQRFERVLRIEDGIVREA